MSTRRCSQCLQRGHTSRNKNCPIKISERLYAEEQAGQTIVEQVTVNNELQGLDLARFHMNKNLNDIADVIHKYTYAVIGIRQFMSQVVPMVSRASDSITAVMTCGVDVSDMFTSLRGLVVTINCIIHRYARNQFNTMMVTLNERGVSVRVTQPSPSVYKAPSPFQKVALVQDLTVEADGPSCECPICLDVVPANDTIYTNCSHGFCGTCIKRYATSIKNKTQNPSCPMCRAEITDLKIGNLQLYNEINNHITTL
jgi:hypothetical protein